MCDPLLIGGGMAATQIAGGMMSARGTNKASEANAEAMARQAKDQMGAQLIERLTALQDTARARFGQARTKQEAIGTIRANFSDIIGTPKTDAERLVKNDAMDTEWALEKSLAISDLNAREAIQSIALGAASGIASLPTVGVAEQALGVAEAGLSGAVVYKGLKNLEADTSLMMSKSGKGTPFVDPTRSREFS